MSELLSAHCQKEHCYVPDTSCDAGFMSEKKCPHYIGCSENNPAIHEEDDEGFPWTGRPMGVIDMRFISSARRPHIVGFAGAADAGKTTLLCLLFLNLYRGRKMGNFDFAGSFTLMGWENIAQHMQLTAGESIQFPPHTSSSGRSPGLLHLRTTNDEGQLQDTLLTDASGEWFSAWTDDSKDERAEGARWVANHADRVLIVADTEALTGEARGSTRRSLEFLIRRVQQDFGTEGVALVWTKTDLKRPKILRNEVESLFTSCFEKAPIFETSIPSENVKGNDETLEQLAALFSWALSPRIYPIAIKLPNSESNDPFISYRGDL